LKQATTDDARKKAIDGDLSEKEVFDGVVAQVEAKLQQLIDDAS